MSRKNLRDDLSTDGENFAQKSRSASFRQWRH